MTHGSNEYPERRIVMMAREWIGRVNIQMELTTLPVRSHTEAEQHIRHHVKRVLEKEFGVEAVINIAEIRPFSMIGRTLRKER